MERWAATLNTEWTLEEPETRPTDQHPPAAPLVVNIKGFCLKSSAFYSFALFSLILLSCSSEGKSVLVKGTNVNDVVCGPTLTGSSPGTTSATVPAPATGEPGSCFLALQSSDCVMTTAVGI